MLKCGAEIVALKLGREGCLVCTKEETLRVSGFSVEVVDTTGAGDAFDGAFVVYWRSGRLGRFQSLRML
ncbi:hypothetical protein J7L06_05360 [Candidatus Bathyarchaeota archaeon]|nr:hypothetical protein [Candidatus Bathyarchaeota archaeon]